MASEKLKDLQGYKAEEYEADINSTKIESLIYELSEHDISKIEIIKKTSYEIAMTYLYKRRIGRLNELLDSIASFESMKKK